MTHSTSGQEGLGVRLRWSERLPLTQEAAGSSPLAPAKGSEHSLKLVGEWVEDLPRMERRQRDHRFDLGRSDLGPSTADK